VAESAVAGAATAGVFVAAFVALELSVLVASSALGEESPVLAGVEDAELELSLLLSDELAELSDADDPEELESELLPLSEDELEPESLLLLLPSEEEFDEPDDDEPELCEESAAGVESSAYVLKKG